MPRPLCLIILTWNEARRIDACLDAVAAQTSRAFEVLVVDAASTDGTAERVRQRRTGFPVPLRLHVANQRIPIGEARNLGVQRTEHPYIAFLSADAEPAEDWVERALKDLEAWDMVFGRQVHEPERWTVGAAVRGLRYHYPRLTPADPLGLASNVAAAYHRQVLESFPFDRDADAAEDLLLARRAHRAGFTGYYDADLLVRHHDVSGAREELRKNVREGIGWGENRQELGLFAPVLAWGLLIVVAAGLLVVRAGLPTAGLLALVLWLPALRRAARRWRAMPKRELAIGVLATPPFDLVFLANYLRGLLRQKPAPQDAPPQGGAQA